MDLPTFLAHAVRLELDAEQAYLQLIELMQERGNRDATEFFREMAGYSRLHRETAMRRAGFNDLAEIPELIAAWPASQSESPNLKDAEGPLDLDDATYLALAAEQRGVSFYTSVAQAASDPQTRQLAEEFAAEERGHVLALERFLGLKPY